MNNVAKTDTVKVFVAATPSEWLPMKVLEFSIRETTSLPVEVSAMYTFNRAIPMPSSFENQPRTPFSFQRFLIPELCDYSGKAIYMDADMQVFQDIKSLWNQDFAGCDLQTVKEMHKGRRGQFSVMLLDCQSLKWNVEHIIEDLDSGKIDYADLMYNMCVAKKIGRDVLPEWNSLESYDSRRTCLLHYTDMKTQPWVSTTNSLGEIWIACLRRAIRAGFVSNEEIEQEVLVGHVRPSLLAQLNTDLDDCVKLPYSVRKLDRNFVPPYRSLQCAKASPWMSIQSIVRAFVKRSYYSSPLPRFFN